jgi:hypothetical protein
MQAGQDQPTRPFLTVYRVMRGAKSDSFGIGIPCKSWREANAARRQIALAGDPQVIPLTYYSDGSLAAEGWQKEKAR